MITPEPVSAGVVERYLILGDAALQFPMRRTSITPLVVVPLPAVTGGQAAVELLRADQAPGPGPLRVVDPGGLDGIRDLAALPSEAFWSGTVLSPAVRPVMRSALPAGADERCLDQLAPLAVLRVHGRGEPSAEGLAEVLACTRLRASGTLFTRVARVPLVAGDGLGALVARALRVLEVHHPHVLTETEGCTGLTADIEVETKLVLRGRLSPWALATRLSTLVGTDALPGFIPDLGNEMQRWQTYQRTWEVQAPPGEAGYLALIHYGSEGYALKRKRFQSDGLRREETFRFGLDVPADNIGDYVRSLYPDLRLRTLPSHRRAKFDVNVESTATGHFFGIEIDEILVEGTDLGMSQLEIEYHRSRIHDGLDAAGIEPELMRLTALVEGLVTGFGEAPVRTFYSKLSFLRDIADTSTSPFVLAAREAEAVTR